MTGINGETNKGTYANPYKISTARDLDTLSYWVRQGTSTSRCVGTYFQMTNNIDMSLPTAHDAAGTLCNRSARATNFIPIGGRYADLSTPTLATTNDITTATQAAAAYTFAGHFNGNNYEIVNMQINDNSKSYCGLFNLSKGIQSGIIDTIQNLTMRNCTVTGGSRCGILIGIVGSNVGTYANASTYLQVNTINVHFVNCTVNATGAYAGIVCGENGPGRAYRCSVTNCAVNVTGGDFTGGFVGDGEDCDLEQCWINGITVTNTGGGKGTGGFMGDIDQARMQTCYISNAVVKSNGQLVGGAVGYYYSSSTINNVYSTAKVYKTGGSYNTFGGFTGQGSPSNSFYIDTWNPEGTSFSGGGGTSKTEAVMKSASFITTLNNSSSGTNPWRQDYTAPWGTGVNNGFPIFGTNDVIPFYIHDWETVTVTTDDQVTSRPMNIIIEDGGSLINNAPSATITGGVNFVRYMYNERYTLLGTACKQNPTTHISAGDFLGWNGDNNYLCVETNQKVDLLAFSYNTNMWSNGSTYNILAYDDEMVRGAGYLGYVYDTRYNSALGNPWQNVTNRGEAIPLNATNVNLAYSYDDFSLTATNTGNVHTLESNTDGIWFALSNPYPGSLYAKNFIATNSSKLSTQYLYNLNADNTWNAIGTNSTDRIKHGEGFFVSGKHHGTPMSWNFTRTMMNTPSKKNETIKAHFDINVTSSITSTATFMFNDNASNGFDEMDAYKFIGMNEDAVEPYFFVDGNEIVINSISTLPYECPMNIYAYKDFNIEIEFDNVPSGLEVSLIDGIDTIDMSNGGKYITDVVTGTNENRFRVKIGGEFNGLEKALANNLDVWVTKDRLNINGENLKDITVYNAVGQVVYNNKLSGSSFSDVLNLPNGAYTAKASAKNNSKTIKFIITK
ncbi:MAG: T9SS type A sorting domain-containing protein [Bacteroidales bacterium]|nr:T9SS type A sorting domain-containing protein [Bacteroidales bacterium]